MKKLKEELKYGKKGITLIALVITIIVLLILAGVTIATLTGDNGILTRASEAREETEISTEKEQIQLALIEYEMDSLNKDKYALIEKETKQKILDKTEESILEGEIIELENGRKYLITDNTVEYIENIENAILLNGRTGTETDEEWWTNNKLVGQNIYSRDQVEYVYIVNNKNIPQNAIYSWDISQNQDNSVMSWVMDTDNNGLYEWYIGANYRIKANSMMSYYFYNLTNCIEIKGLEYLDLTNTIYIFDMFMNSNKLTELNLNKWNTSNITNMTGVFAGCSSLEKVDLSSWDTSKVTLMVEMFYHCTNLKQLDLNNFNTKLVTNMQSMFGYCTNLEKIDLSSFDTTNVTNMGGMFRNLRNLEILNLNSFYTANVTTFNAMFFDSYGIQELDISNFNIDENVDYTNFLNNVSNNIKVYVKDLEMKNKLLDKFGNYLLEENVIIK